MIRKIIFSGFFVLFTVSIVVSQCHIDVTLPTADTTICAGDSLYLKSDGTCTYLMNNNFNNQTIGAGWSSTAANPVYNNPCGNGPAGWHLWVGTTASSTRTLETNAYDVSIGNCVIKWWMRYGRIQGSGACEDPDAQNEGVHLQYSTNNGATWTDFPGPNLAPVGTNSTVGPYTNVTTVPGSGGYWQPISSASSQANSTLYYWHKYENTVPPVASTSSTKFRWAQLSNSSAGWDAWGIDEVQISCPNNQNVIWSHGPTVLNPPNAVAPTTTTEYIVAIFDSMNNLAVDTVLVNVIPKPTPDLGPDTMVCDYPGNTAIFDAGSGYSTYLWSNGATTQTITPSVSGSYSVTVMDGNCTGSDTVNLTMSPGPTADAGPDVDICLGDNTTLTAQAVSGANYYWSDSSTTASITVSPAQTTTYYVTVSIGQNCMDVDSVTVTVNPLPTADAGADQTICKGESVVLTANGGSNYSWSTGDNTSSITLTPINTETYTVTVTDANGCISIDQVKVNVHDLPNVVIAANKEALCLGDSLTLTGMGASTYEWSTGQTGTVIILTPEGSTTYTVTGTDNNGCQNTDAQVIFAEDCSTFFMPNSFTPNGDGQNDVFGPGGDFDGIIEFNMKIYNRFGEMIFETFDITNGWRGDYNDQPAQGGTYVYIVRFKTVWNKEFEKKGTVMLFR